MTATRRRDALPARERARLAKLIAGSFEAAFDLPVGTVVAGYWPMRSEVDVRPILEAVFARGAETCLPRIVVPHAGLGFRKWSPGDSLEPGPFGTRQPAVSAEPLVPDVLLLPLLAFDAQGGRLGYGGGYYDRTLGSLRRVKTVRAVGIAFSAQAVDAVPMGPGDEFLDAIVTETGVLWPIPSARA